MFAVYSRNDMWQMDLLDMSEYSRMNDGYKYLQCVIDVFSRKAFVIAMKHRRDIPGTLNEIFTTNDAKPIVLQTYNRPEFTTNSIKTMLNKHSVRHVSVASDDLTKQAYIERFKRTLRSKLTKRYTVDNLNETITAYNNTKHHSLNDTPNNRYNQNPSRGVITAVDNEMEEEYNRKKKRMTTLNDRKRLRSHNESNNINRKKSKIRR